MELAITYAQLFFFAGILVAFLDIIPDQLVPVMSQWTSPNSVFAKREVIIIFVAVVILCPMMFIRNIQKLSPLATFSVLAIFYTMAMFVVKTSILLSSHPFPKCVMGEPKTRDISLFRASVDILKSIPLFGSAYFVHTTYPLVFAELNPSSCTLAESPKRSLTKGKMAMDKAAGVAMLVCFGIYIVVGVSGYIYGTVNTSDGVVPGDALLMFPNGG
jgi:hypothetical protein